jgi:hypothetical protein
MESYSSSDRLVRRYIKKHFADFQGLTSLFPSVKRSFKWKDVPLDVRTIL